MDICTSVNETVSRDFLPPVFSSNTFSWSYERYSFGSFYDFLCEFAKSYLKNSKTQRCRQKLNFQKLKNKIKNPKLVTILRKVKGQKIRICPFKRYCTDERVSINIPQNTAKFASQNMHYVNHIRTSSFQVRRVRIVADTFRLTSFFTSPPNITTFGGKYIYIFIYVCIYKYIRRHHPKEKLFGGRTISVHQVSGMMVHLHCRICMISTYIQ